MVICWIAGPAVVAGAIAAPAAIALNTATLHAMGNTAHTGVPASTRACTVLDQLSVGNQYGVRHDQGS
jgi:hypothetical protein